MGPRVELKQEPVSPLIVIKIPWVILLTSGLLFVITTALHLVGRAQNIWAEPWIITTSFRVWPYYRGSSFSSVERLRLQRVRQRVRVTSSFARGESHLAVVNV